MKELILKNKIKAFRHIKGMTQTELAIIVGTSRNTISSIETGQFQPTAYTSGLICKALECKWEELFYYERK